ncbi:MAG: DUF4430 domain-containing protein [Candidatus Bathyarchaeota archaeon]|nr:DUF4430 domain-containing protein [Candidatus Bathyarchaeota archaeon]
MQKVNYKKLVIIFIFLVFLAGVFFISGEILLENQVKIYQEKYQAALRALSGVTIKYIVNKGEGEARIYQVTFRKDSTAFSLLERLGEREDFEIESKVYEGMGVLVESIDNVENGTDGKYWQYWVNDELPMVAADKKGVKSGDKVEWRFEKPAF